MVTARILLAALALFAIPAVAQAPPRFGVNLEGCTCVANGALCPTVDDVAWYVDKAGFRSIRLPFHGAQASDPVVLQHFYDIVKAAKARNVPVILDRHDYKWPTPAEQVAFSVPYLRKMDDQDMVMIDLINEPRFFNDPVMTNDWMQWVRDTNEIVAGIRKAGFKNPILVEWPQWSASFRFDKSQKAGEDCVSGACAIDRSGGLIDPLNRIVLSPHRYFDKGASGTSAICVPDRGTAGGLREFAAAARKRGHRAILGESAFGGHQGVAESCAPIAKQVVAAIKADGDVWMDVEVWGGGRAWKEEYFFKIEPKKGTRDATPLSSYVNLVTGK
jgi:endoglucanase